MKFNMLTVLCQDYKRNKIEYEKFKNKDITRNRIFWICQCDCGNFTSVRSGDLTCNKTMSCGCFRNNKLYNKINPNEYEEFDTYYKGWDRKHENYFLISKEDYEEVSKYCWHKDNRGYWTTHIKNNKYTHLRMHQLIVSIHYNNYDRDNKNIVPDHIDRNRNNNTYQNLRLVTKRENNINKTISKSNKNEFVGVSHIKNDKKKKKWIARINVDGKTKTKAFNTFEEAVEQRLKWEKEYYNINT